MKIISSVFVDKASEDQFYALTYEFPDFWLEFENILCVPVFQMKKSSVKRLEEILNNKFPSEVKFLIVNLWEL